MMARTYPAVITMQWRRGRMRGCMSVDGCSTTSSSRMCSRLSSFSCVMGSRSGYRRPTASIINTFTLRRMDMVVRVEGGIKSVS